MTNKDLLLAHFDRETAITRRMLEKTPMDRADWKPHPKSMEFGRLRALVATMPAWFQSILDDAELDVAPTDGRKFTNTDFNTHEELMAGFEACVARGRDAFVRTDDDRLKTTWRMLAAGHKVSEDPRHQVVSDTLAHWAHHRGQLSVYLRLSEVPLPSIYGPTADNRSF